MEREQVIKGMEEVVRDFKDEIEGWGRYTLREIYGGISVNCDWYYRAMQKCEAGLELLKRDAPRVMTLEEVLHLKFDDVVFFELSVTGVVISAIVIDVIEHMPDGNIGLIQFRHIQEPTNNADLEYYGKTWRCWTDRPSKEQMQATPWRDE